MVNENIDTKCDRRNFLGNSALYVASLVAGSAALMLGISTSDAVAKSGHGGSSGSGSRRSGRFPPSSGQTSSKDGKPRQRCHKKRVCRQVQCITAPCNPICTVEEVCS